MWTCMHDAGTVRTMTRDENEQQVLRLIGRNIARARRDEDWSQDELAAEARVLGLRWTQATVAAVEGGRRSLTPWELPRIAAALRKPLAYLYGGDDVLPLADGLTVLAQHLSDNIGANKPPVDTSSAPIRAARIKARVDDAAEAHRHAARRLNRSEQEVRRAAHKLWGRTLADKRERLLSEQGEFGLEDDPRRRQALRGHITRDLLRQLQEHFAQHGGEQ